MTRPNGDDNENIFNGFLKLFYMGFNMMGLEVSQIFISFDFNDVIYTVSL